MEWYLLFSILLGGLIGLMILGIPVFLSFVIINLVGIYFLWGWNGILNYSHALFSSIANFVFFPIPMFILMGDIIARSGVFVKVIETLDMWIGGVRGRLIFLAIGAATIFAALSGSAQGTAAMLGALLLPEMYKRGYKRYMAVGSCMSGALAQLIPPSAFAVILGSLAQVSIGKLLIGGVLPGLVTAGCYVAVTFLLLKIDPEIAKDYMPKKYPLKLKLKAVAKNILPFGSIMFLVTGLIFFGICAPTESAVLGVFGSLIVIAIYKNFSWGILKESFENTLYITGMMLLIVANALAFSQMLAYSGASEGFCEFVVNSFKLSPVTAVIIMQIVYLVLGCFMEQASIIMITFPIFLPIIKALEINEIWFCILTLMNMGIAMKSPPFGLTLFVIQGTAPKGTTLRDIYLGAWVFIFCDFLAMVIVFLFPEIALLLPRLMR